MLEDWTIYSVYKRQIKYGETEITQTPDVVFWASVYKAICGIKDAPETIVSKAKAWLHEHGMSHNLAE